MLLTPVAKMQTLKVLFSFCCQNGLIIEQMNVVTAFLNGEVSSEVYVGQPKGYSDGTNKVCKLRKAHCTDYEKVQGHGINVWMNI